MLCSNKWPFISWSAFRSVRPQNLSSKCYGGLSSFPVPWKQRFSHPQLPFPSRIKSPSCCKNQVCCFGQFERLWEILWRINLFKRWFNCLLQLAERSTTFSFDKYPIQTKFAIRSKSYTERAFSLRLMSKYKRYGNKLQLSRIRSLQ